MKESFLFDTTTIRGRVNPEGGAWVMLQSLINFNPEVIAEKT